MDFWQNAVQIAVTILGGGLIIWFVVNLLFLCVGGERKDKKHEHDNG